MICKLVELRNNIQSDEDYKALLIKRNKRCRLLGLYGVLTIIIGMTTSSLLEKDFMKGFLLGAGWGLIIVSCILYLNNKRVLSNKKKLHEQRLAIKDERNQMLEQQAMAITFYSMFALCYCAMIVSMFFSQGVMITITLVMVCVAMLVVFLISKKVLSLRY